MRPETEAALESLQAWASANPEHLAEIINYFGAQLLAESFHHITKPEAENRQELDSVVIAVAPTRTGMPPLWVLVSNRPVIMPELVMVLSERRKDGVA